MPSPSVSSRFRTISAMSQFMVDPFLINNPDYVGWAKASPELVEGRSVAHHFIMYRHAVRSAIMRRWLINIRSAWARCAHPTWLELLVQCADSSCSEIPCL